jgi:hypothetical protein
MQRGISECLIAWKAMQAEMQAPGEVIHDRQKVKKKVGSEANKLTSKTIYTMKCSEANKFTSKTIYTMKCSNRWQTEGSGELLTKPLQRQSVIQLATWNVPNLFWIFQ